MNNPAVLLVHPDDVNIAEAMGFNGPKVTQDMESCSQTGEVIVIDSVPQEEEPSTVYSKVRSKLHIFGTVLGWMTLRQYAVHVASLTPQTFKRNYVYLEDCGHKFTTTRPPKGGCTVCWNAFFEANPDKVAFLKVGLDQGYGSDIRARFGSETVNQLVRKIAEDMEAENEAIFSVAEQLASSVQPDNAGQVYIGGMDGEFKHIGTATDVRIEASL